MTVLIVGAGPAGIRAAETLVKAGLRPVVVDEGARAGGQIYRRTPSGFVRVPSKLYGSEALKAVDLHRTFDRMVEAGQVAYRPKSSVMALRDGVAQLVGPDEMSDLRYDRLILATGAMDRVLPIDGWQSGGVYTLGAMQIALKAQGGALGQQIVLLGTGPLLTLLASQLLKAGADVRAVLDTSPMRSQVKGGTRMLAARPLVTFRGLSMRAGLRRVYHAGVTGLRIDADVDGPTAVHWRDASGRQHRTKCDAVGMGWHLRAETHLADLAGAQFRWDEDFAQWQPQVDEMGRGAKGLYLAGDGARLLGADAAEIAGRLAGIACLQDLGLTAPDPSADLRQMRRMQRFARGMQSAFPWPAKMAAQTPDHTVLCRCEGITAGELRHTTDWSGPEANRAKSLGRVGMGRCQGRYCQLAGAEIIAAQSGLHPKDVGRLRAQAPVRPVPIQALIKD
ncbi:FAD-dependent oxidoreductase [Donghicola sp. C2-DW-16]|uniref:FAD-dependent oxidoreductase n=1 Tax=Donghicola mangrovi TaxID=2729614 RepID=A0ABX2PDJ4_9RHOB|nr:FAD/NAD(P)-binding oxidoreductase [Donghicola mangrovi]NVO27536.1 FAD-dependent oxidoreductase [Donghicola mangrovi]